MRHAFRCLSVLTAIVVGTSLPVVVATRTLYADPAGKVGNDVSWPNCKTEPPRDAGFGIVGVTGGLVFKPNPCLFAETQWFDNPALYLNTGYEGKAVAEKFTDAPLDCSFKGEACLAYNFGFNAGAYALRYAASQDIHANTWWLDVETVNDWSANAAYNRAALQGMVDSIKANTLLPTIGFYAYPGQWRKITDGWRNGYPDWVATGSSSPKLAFAFCKGSAFNGGETLLTQYTTRLDNDYVCR